MVIDKVESSSFFSTKTYYFQNMGLSCEYMQAENEEQHNFLVCFYILKKESTFYLSQNFLSVDTGSLSPSDKYDPVLDEEISSVKLLQTMVNNNKKYSLVCLLLTNNKINCYKFYFKNGFLGATTTEKFDEKNEFNFNCKNELYGMKLNYLADGEKIVLSCINSNSIIKAVFFNSNLEKGDSYEQFSQCNSIKSIYGHSIIQLNSKYYIISDIICDNYKRSYELLNGDLSIITIITTTQQMEEIFEKEEEKKEEEEEKLMEKQEEKKRGKNN